VAELTREQILAAIPHKAPFRFVDEIIEADRERALSRYTFRPDEFFYAGHFPGRPITPGVILTEAMCQMGLLPLGLCNLVAELGAEGAKNFVTVLTDAETEYYEPVLPGTTVTCRAEKIFWKRRKIRARLELRDDKNRLVAAGSAAGFGVPHG
jgi:3-hydroxyacyl-[acyl-carrier-protein] dehydratase